MAQQGQRTQIAQRPVQPRAPNVIEKTREYRRPPIEKNPPAYDDITPAIRPGKGRRGIPFDLKVNWFRIKFTSRQMYIYEVTVAGGRKARNGIIYKDIKNDRGKISKCVYKVIHSYRDVFHNPWRVFFDDFEYLFTPDPLEARRQISLYTNDNNEQFRVTIRYQSDFLLELTGRPGSIDAQWSTIFIKLLLSQNARFIPPESRQDDELSIHSRFAHFGGGMYFVHKPVNRVNEVRRTAMRKLVQPGVEAWMGFYISKRYTEDLDPVINFGMTHEFFLGLNLNLLDIYIAILKKLGGNNPNFVLRKTDVMSPEGIADFTNRFSELKVKCFFAPMTDKDGYVIGKMERNPKFVRLMETNQCADNYYLEVIDPIHQWKRRVRLDEWYAQQEPPIILQYPKLPLCEAKVGRNFLYLPMELLFTPSKPQKYMNLLDPIARLEIPKLLTHSPQEHYRFTRDMVAKKMEYDTDPFLREMGITMDKEMVECSGRVLNIQEIIANDDSGAKIPMNAETGKYVLDRAYETTEKEVIFVACKLTDIVDAPSVKSFCRGLVESCKSHGMKVSDKQIYREVNEDGLQKFFEDSLASLERRRRLDSENMAFLFFVGNSHSHLYGQIKMLGDLFHGAVTQVIKENTVLKFLPNTDDMEHSYYKPIYHNIWRKLNVKLGGVNQIVDFSDSSAPEGEGLPTHEKTMFIGIDAIHPSPKSPIHSFTLAAIVASIDRHATKFATRIMVNVKCNETIQHFEDHFALLLKEYVGERGHLPERVVIFRDGVSDSELYSAASRELRSIKGAWLRCSNGVPLPPFTYIVVQKRHGTRFYRSDIMERNANPFPATVISEGAVSPHKWDFYMISQYTPEGTSVPAHYIVVVDESNFSTDEMTEMCFRSCCTYARCSRPVKIPAPVYYADLRCTRAADQFNYAVRIGEQEEIKDKGKYESDQKYADRVNLHAQKIEKFLNQGSSKEMFWL